MHAPEAMVGPGVRTFETHTESGGPAPQVTHCSRISNRAVRTAGRGHGPRAGLGSEWGKPGGTVPQEAKLSET